ncbi:hypothetical protein [Haloglomus litoreum]|uniref:hypothetical protein n=1 Tax=Haloglomus litoreum TaxID=3034026 RepID=UPI0023E81430|nr:hypothetical protein [Haloglomus sp. DT116]
MSKLRRVLGIIEGHEEELARTIGKRTSVSESQARQGLEKAQELIGNSGNGSN